MENSIINLLFIVIVTCGFSTFIMPLMKKIAFLIGATDKPTEEEGHRHIHKKEISKLGGVGVYFAFLIGYMLFGKYSHQMNSILIGSFVVIFTGIIDDITSIGWKKLLGHFSAAIIVTIYGGLLLQDITAFGYEFSQVPNMPKVFAPHPEDIMKVKSVLKKLNLDYKMGVIGSGDKFVTSYDSIKDVKDRIIACEMEGASIAHTAIRLGKRFIILRYISDVVGEPSQIDDYSKFEEDMANRSSKITLDLIRNL